MTCGGSESADLLLSGSESNDVDLLLKKADSEYNDCLRCIKQFKQRCKSGTKVRRSRGKEILSCDVGVKSLLRYIRKFIMQEITEFAHELMGGSASQRVSTD